MIKVRAIGLALIVLMVISMSTSTFAISANPDELSEEQAKQIASEKLGINFNESDGNVFVDYYADDYEGESMWNIRLEKYTGSITRYVYIRIGANSGNIYNIDLSEYNNNPTSEEKITKYTKDEAQEVADEYVIRMNPDKAGLLEYKEETYDYYYDQDYIENPAMYRFRYVMKYKEVTVDSNNIYVTVNGATGKVTNYSYHWRDVELPEVENIIDKEEALKVYGESVNMELMYRPIYKQSSTYGQNEKEISLIYYPRYNGYGIDAKTGQWVSYEYMGEKRNKEISEDRLEELKTKADKINTRTGEVTKEEAEKIAKNAVGFLVDRDIEIKSINKQNNEWENREVWAINWSFEVNKDKDAVVNEGNIQVDCTTGEIVRIYMNTVYPYNEIFEPKISWEEGYDKAVDAIEEFDLDKVKELDWKVEYYDNKMYVDDKEVPNPMYMFNFRRMVNGVPYEGDNIFVEINSKTGEITSYSKNWDGTVIFPVAENAISKDAALEKYFNKNELELKYIVINKNSYGSQPKFQSLLVYGIEPNQFNTIDALTGEFIDYQGQIIKDPEEVVSIDELVEGRSDAKELKLLAAQKIIDPNTFDPEANITKKEFIKLLVRAKGFDRYMTTQMEDLKFKDLDKEDKYYDYIKGAVRIGLIDDEEENLNPDAPVTREEMAVLLVKLTGYSELAKAKDIFKLNYNDSKNIPEEVRPYIAILKGLEVLDDRSSFNPKENITMAEAAKTAYRALSKILMPRY